MLHISSPQELDLSLVTSLDALTSVHQVHGLNVKQLKLILQQNCINYKGCVEKDELQVRVRRLWQAKEDERIKVAAIVQAGDLGKGWGWGKGEAGRGSRWPLECRLEI